MNRALRSLFAMSMMIAASVRDDEVLTAGPPRAGRYGPGPGDPAPSRRGGAAPADPAKKRARAAQRAARRAQRGRR